MQHGESFKPETLGEAQRRERRDLNARFEPRFADADKYDMPDEKQKYLDGVFEQYRQIHEKLAERHRRQIKKPCMDNEVAGVVTRVVYHNEETGAAILTVRPHDGSASFTVVGSAPEVSFDENLRARGKWVFDAKYGRQFKADVIELFPPFTVNGVAKYLAASQTRGLGPKTAQRIADFFGEQTFLVIETAPQLLTRVQGVDADLAERIAATLAERRLQSESISYLMSLGVGYRDAMRIYEIYGEKMEEQIRADAYQIARTVPGIGFRTADRIALKFGLPKDDPKRVASALGFALHEESREGHCGFPRDEAIQRAARFTGLRRAIVSAVLDSEIAQRNIAAESIRDIPCVFLPRLFNAEWRIAKQIQRLSAGSPPWESRGLEAEIARFQKQDNVSLDNSQRTAIERILTSKFTVMTGGPGVGKTTLINAVLRILAKRGVDIALAAPTGRAAKRMREQTGREAKTIHRLLEVDRFGYFKRWSGDPLECDFLILDECSMIDAYLMHDLLAAVPSRAAILFVGDADQLPSVGPGRILGDIIDSNSVETVRLTKVHRQTQDSRIIHAAHAVNRGETPELSSLDDENADFCFIETENMTDSGAKILELVYSIIPARINCLPIDIQLLCPIKKGDLGTENMNAVLQAILNPDAGERVESGGHFFSVGDRVMQIHNDYQRDVFNGDTGVVSGVDAQRRSLVVTFDDRDVAYSPKDLHNLVLAYAITIHKSQGSEYQAIVIPITGQHRRMLNRNLLYTAMTRGRNLVVIVGDRAALDEAIKTVDAAERWTKLRDWLIKRKETSTKKINIRKIIERIKALKNKTVEKGCTEPEALAALNKVKALMSAYSINEQDIY